MNQNTATTVKVWDPLIRVFHWAMVAAFIIAYATGEDESSIHAYAGYVIMGLIGFRILWGLIGTTYARFSNFIYSPATTLHYLKSLFTNHPKHYLGHNPAAGMMVILMLIALVVATLTGLKAYGVEGHGPLASNSISMSIIATAQADEDHYEDHDDDDEYERHGYSAYEYHEEEENEEEEFWEELHEASVNFLLLLVILHVLGVLVSSYLHNENLVRAMVTGRKHSSADS